MVVPDAMVPSGAKASATAMLIFGGWHLAGAVAGVVPITKCSRRVSAGPRIFAIVGLRFWKWVVQCRPPFASSLIG